MVDLLSSALKQLNKENRKQALLISVGKSRASKNFCKGSFPAVLADEWWSHWNVRARDVVVLRRTDCGDTEFRATALSLPFCHVHWRRRRLRIPCSMSWSAGAGADTACLLAASTLDAFHSKTRCFPQ